MQKLLISIIFSTLLLGCSENTPTDTTSNATSTNAANATNDNYTEGVHYRILTDPINSASDDIVVTEFFWYGCSHCANFEPSIHQWDANKPSGVSLEQSPAIWNETMKLHAKAFYVAQAVENKKKLHAQLFTEIMALRDQKSLDRHKEKLASIFSQYGMTQEEFYQQLDSFKINGQVNKAAKRMKQAEIKGTPTLVVNGKYVILNKSIKSTAELLTIANFLIQKEKSLAKQ